MKELFNYETDHIWRH